MRELRFSKKLRTNLSRSCAPERAHTRADPKALSSSAGDHRPKTTKAAEARDPGGFSRRKLVKIA
jgi:hypothetical protein